MMILSKRLLIISCSIVFLFLRSINSTFAQLPPPEYDPTPQNTIYILIIGILIVAGLVLFFAIRRKRMTPQK